MHLRRDSTWFAVHPLPGRLQAPYLMDDRAYAFVPSCRAAVCLLLQFRDAGEADAAQILLLLTVRKV